MATRAPVRIDGIDASSYTIPTDRPESDGTLAWNSTTLVLVEVTAGHRRGLGYTYADRATAELVESKLAPLLVGHDAFAISGAWDTMVRAVRNLGSRGIAAMAISAVAAGEYGYMPVYFQRMLAAGAVDVLQADATRCLGITGFLGVAALCLARSLPLSAHCAPQLHAHLGCALPSLRHVEYFHDHVRIENLLFEGTIPPKDGELSPDRSRPGLGIELKREDAQRFAA